MKEERAREEDERLVDNEGGRSFEMEMEEYVIVMYMYMYVGMSLCLGLRKK